MRALSLLLAAALVSPAAAEKTPAEAKTALAAAYAAHAAPDAADFAGKDAKLVSLYKQVVYLQGAKDDDDELYAKMVRTVGYQLGYKPGQKLEAVVKVYLEQGRRRVIAANSDELASRRDIIDAVAKRNAAGLATTKLRTSAIMKTAGHFQKVDDNLNLGNAGDGSFAAFSESRGALTVSATKPTGNADLIRANYAKASYQPLTDFRTTTVAPAAPDVTVKPSFFDRVSSAYGTATAYVAQKIDQAKENLTGAYRTIRNKFYEGVELMKGYGYDLLFGYRDRHYATKPMADGIRSISAYLRSSGISQTDLLVGDISSSKGGQLGGHLSHRRGVDADIGYFMVDAKTGEPVAAQGFVEFGEDLRGWSGGKAVRFDSKRNWELVKAIVANPDPKFKPVYIFMSLHLEKAVLAEAKSEDANLRAKAAVLMHQWPGHGNHLHLRIE